MKRRSRRSTLLIYFVVIFWSFIVLFPYYWLATTSFKKPLDATRFPKYVPFYDFQPTTEHWDYILTQRWDKTSGSFRNSLIIASGSTFLAVLLGSMAGYGLSRFKYYWKRLRWRNDNIAFWIISQRFLPPAVFIIPFMIAYVDLGLIDTHAGLIIAYTMFNIPFAVWIMRDFFNGLPTDLEDSARVDGATRWKAFYRIVLPLSAPGLVSVAILSFIFSWNEYLYSLMLTNAEAVTLPPFIAAQNTQRGVEWWYISALAMLAIVPVILFGLALERFITRGLVAGALKG
ncbi:carbohydrate ABC transporter permease [Aggregatilinea lenta]|uniref:carbohydrate ABC transporter permease n=1 Tax=Aggregatilinea lenta TaxID=913108 RepID=UPI000E5A1A42|nr:carbohydrate ABC transporter permease [Aggregatilinea lenta]